MVAASTKKRLQLTELARVARLKTDSDWMPTSLLFSGHMVDLPGRKEPRFPASLEKAVEKRIAEAVNPYARLTDVAGFASAARGADIIFHEQCRAAEFQRPS